MPSFAPRGRDDQVAGQRDLEAAGDREALDRGDQRLARGALGDAGEAAVADPGALAGDEGLEVHARAEARPGAREDADAQRRRRRRARRARRRRPRRARRLTALRASGRLSVIEQDVAAALGQDCGCGRVSLMAGEPTAARRRSGREQREVGLALAAQHGEVDLDPGDARGSRPARGPAA